VIGSDASLQDAKTVEAMKKQGAGKWLVGEVRGALRIPDGAGRYRDYRTLARHALTIGGHGGDSTNADH
jgi:hypothetical protein